MRRMGTVVLFLAVAGCNGAESDGRWVPASDALAAHGVADWRASATANSQQVVLRDADRQSIGELQLVQAEPSSTISLEFRSDVWKQIVFAAEGKMTLSLDGREATLTWENGTWIGDAAAQSLLAESQPYADFVKLVGSEAQLGLATSATSAPATSSPDASAPADLGGLHAPPPTLCCGEVVTTGSGWAWYWEEHAEATACKRAIDTLQATCDVSSGYDCCSLPKSGCTACVNWGTGFACSTAGYLQYVPLKGTTCR